MTSDGSDSRQGVSMKEVAFGPSLERGRGLGRWELGRGAPGGWNSLNKGLGVGKRGEGWGRVTGSGWRTQRGGRRDVAVDGEGGLVGGGKAWRERGKEGSCPEARRG